PAARRLLAWKAALRLPDDVRPTPTVQRHPPGDVPFPGPELTRPDLAPGSVVLANEGVQGPRGRLAGQRAEGLSGDVGAAFAVDDDGRGLVQSARSELARPGPGLVAGGG